MSYLLDFKDFSHVKKEQNYRVIVLFSLNGVFAVLVSMLEAACSQSRVDPR